MGVALAAGLLAGQAMPPVTSLEGVVRDALTGQPLNKVDVWVDTNGKQGDIELEPGDNVVVPRLINTVTVLGAVLDQVVNVADAAMYRAKAEGRDRIVLAPGPAIEPPPAERREAAC